MSPCRQLRAWAQAGKRPHGAVGLQHAVFQHAVRADLAVIANHAVFQHAAGADFHPVTQLDVTFDNHIRINSDVAAVNKFPTQIETRRIQQHHAGQQQFFRLFRLEYALQGRQLQAVVYAFHFAQTRRVHGFRFSCRRHGPTQ